MKYLPILGRKEEVDEPLSSSDKENKIRYLLIN
jgi:hypothetical protein